nr:PREDICTED: pectinesterase-like isoform X3 [Bemisia tabaci]
MRCTSSIKDSCFATVLLQVTMHYTNIRSSNALPPFIACLLVLHSTGITEATIWPHETDLQIARQTCEKARFPLLCISTLTSFPNLASKSIPQMIRSVLNHTVHEVHSCSHDCVHIKKNHQTLANTEQIALDDCIHLFDDTNSTLRTAIADLERNELGDLQTALSRAMTNLGTCLDSLAHCDKNKLRERFHSRLSKLSNHVSNSLAMLHKVPNLGSPTKSEVFPEYGEMKGEFPEWLSDLDRRSLTSHGPPRGHGPRKSLKAGPAFDIVVAQDGSGRFKTVWEAINAAPANNRNRYTIYIKAGVYVENPWVPKEKINLMLVGDGIGRTILKGSKNVVDGSTTFTSATLAVIGNGFIARGITFENVAGSVKHQAVAVRNSADMSVFYQCAFLGFQDTLYTHAGRQFYRECQVAGTIDFIFGDAAAVFQNCDIIVRKPDPSQTNVITAQGREDPRSNTGISIINCKIYAGADLAPVKAQFKTYLGRPWKMFSRTVFMKSFIDDLINPAGWLEWDKGFGLTTLYYGEYQNTGPGANTAGRVKWSGYRVITNEQEAGMFTVDKFIAGNTWLKWTGVPFFPWLS